MIAMIIVIMNVKKSTLIKYMLDVIECKYDKQIFSSPGNGSDYDKQLKIDGLNMSQALLQ